MGDLRAGWDPPAEYKADCAALTAAARDWVRTHPKPLLLFAQTDKNAAIIATLSQCMEWWPQSPDARSLLEAFDRATEGRATFLMAWATIQLIGDARPLSEPRPRGKA